MLTPTQVLRRLTVVEDVDRQTAAAFRDADVAMESSIRKAVYAICIITEEGRSQQGILFFV